MKVEWDSTQPTFIPGKRQYLFYSTEKGMELFSIVIERVKEANLNYELKCIEESSELSIWLSQQKMGSYLYVNAPFELLQNLKQIAKSIGFSEDEVQYFGFGLEKRKVFCCRCHGMTEIMMNDKASPEIECDHCHLLLAVSTHYSSLRDAYLGYVAKL